jgi:hypothetical protein
MGPMRRTAAVAAVSLTSLGLAVGACTKESPRMAGTCVDAGRAGYLRALAAVPRAVLLPGGVKISTCAERVRTDAELQNLGAVVHAAAEDLAARARAGGDQDVAATAAARLGYLSGAVSTGAGRSNGIAAELARRVETTTVTVADDARLGLALRRGASAGRARG